MTQFSGRSRLLVALVAGIALSAPLHAQEITLFTWSGRVDRRVELTAQGSSTASVAQRGQEYRGRFRTVSAVPQQDGVVRVVVSGGRGEATVVEQPTSSNDYKAIIRIVDRSSGADRYQLTAYYTPTVNGRDNGRDDRRDNGRDRRDNGRDNRRGPGYGRRQNNNQQPAVLHWTGEVDADAEVRWQGASITQQAINGNPLRGVRSTVESTRSRGMNDESSSAVTVSLRSGRGSVDVIQQPSQSNNWTTVVKIRDPQSGYGRYAFDIMRP